MDYDDYQERQLPERFGRKIAVAAVLVIGAVIGGAYAARWFFA